MQNKQIKKIKIWTVSFIITFILTLSVASYLADGNKLYKGLQELSQSASIMEQASSLIREEPMRDFSSIINANKNRIQPIIPKSQSTIERKKEQPIQSYEPTCKEGETAKIRNGVLVGCHSN